MPAEKKKRISMNIGVSPEVAAAIRRFAFERSGQMRGVSDVAEEAFREYLEKRNVAITSA
jgi:hypothetical protein